MTRIHHLVYRYSCLHSHWSAVHGRLPSRFNPQITLSYHTQLRRAVVSVASVPRLLVPIIFGAVSLDQ